MKSPITVDPAISEGITAIAIVAVAAPLIVAALLLLTLVTSR